LQHAKKKSKIIFFKSFLWALPIFYKLALGRENYLRVCRILKVSMGMKHLPRAANDWFSRIKTITLILAIVLLELYLYMYIMFNVILLLLCKKLNFSCFLRNLLLVGCGKGGKVFSSSYFFVSVFLVNVVVVVGVEEEKRESN
jgi:heme O synthase-like polyprenyltransferase